MYIFNRKKACNMPFANSNDNFFMKKIQALALACSISVAATAQINAINPLIEGGFEVGTTFAANGWTEINPFTPDNKWVLNNAAPAYNGTRGAHVSNDNTAWAYTTTAARTCHFMRDIPVPAGAASINLSFYWKGSGQIGSDRMLVYTAPTSVVPAINQPLSPSTGIFGATLVWTQTTLAGSYTLANVSLPSSLAGTTVRLIFTWQNDASGGASPGAAVDNISLTYVCGTPASITGVSPLCPGGLVPLSNVFGGGTWASSNPAVGTISPSGVLTGVAPGTTTVTYTSGSCVSTAVVSVSPQPAAITGEDTVCLGATTTFANSVLGGTWSSSYPTVASVLLTSGIITGNAIGASYITYTMPGGCYTTDTVHVVNVPSVISGPSSVCPGSSISMACTPAGGSWYSMNPGSASINPVSGVVLGVAADTAVIRYESPLGRCPSFKTITINPLPAPIISRDIMCAQGMDTAYDATAGGTWSTLTPGLVSVSPTNGYVTPSGTGGVAVIKYTLPTSCAVTKNITLNPLPTPLVSFDGPTNSLYTDTTYITYQWYHTLFGEIVGATTFKTAGLYNGNYYVIVTDEKGCAGQSANFVYNTSMAVQDIDGTTQVAIFPNPATDVLNISATATVTATVSSMDGKVLLRKSGAGKVFIGALPTGIYMVTVYGTDGSKLATTTVTKQ